MRAFIIEALPIFDPIFPNQMKLAPLLRMFGMPLLGFNFKKLYDQAKT
jgi:hypothetical protein